jgi:hypothetical protein
MTGNLTDSELTARNHRPGTVRHLVLFRYRQDLTRQQRQEVEDRFLALADLCRRHGEPYIDSIETGPANSPEGLDLGLEQGFLVTFGSQGDRNYYLGTPLVSDPAYCDPHHDDFKQFVGTLLATDGTPVVVFDFPVSRTAGTPVAGG